MTDEEKVTLTHADLAYLGYVFCFLLVGLFILIGGNFLIPGIILGCILTVLVIITVIKERQHAKNSDITN